MTQATTPAEIERSLRLILQPGQVTELRALEATTLSENWPATISGYFDDSTKLAAAAAAIKTAKGIYFVPNPIKPALLARSMNAARAFRGKRDSHLTADNDIEVRHWFLVDCDPVKPAADLSASDTEHESA